MQFIGVTEESEVTELVSLSDRPDVTARWVAGLLARGESRSEWCRMVRSDTGHLLAAHIFDSLSIGDDNGAVPTFVQLLGHIDEAAAISLLAHDLGEFGAQSVETRIAIDQTATPNLRSLRESQRSVLDAAGFSSVVERVGLSWSLESPRPRPTNRLTFTTARDLEADLLQQIFAEVGDGSLDHGMRSGRAALGRAPEAARRLDQAQLRNHPDDWFVVGFNESGAPVGYVQSAVSTDERPMLAEIGVVESQRGHHYVDDLLAYGTRIVLGTGRTTIVSDTDQENRPMRAAFARTGYVEFATYVCFQWQSGE